MVTTRRIVALMFIFASLVLTSFHSAYAGVTAAPTISGFWPGSGPPGTFVFVFGSNFDTAPLPGTKVSVNGISAGLVQILDPNLLINN